MTWLLSLLARCWFRFTGRGRALEPMTLEDLGEQIKAHEDGKTRSSGS